SLTYKGQKHVFYSEKEVGPVTTKLYNALYGIQEGDLEDTHGWITRVK
ncbi:branched chain amino acid aminotransferase, partial [Limosilactobacillus fermentum]|nr:branched chain amino acid aminotransferase [Limosilactobacillus fermentum]